MDEAAPAAEPAVGCGRLAEMLATARHDQALAAALLALPRAERLAAAEGDASLRRPTLAAMLTLRAEAALEAPTTEAAEAAELAASIAGMLPRDPEGKARRAAALAQWLLGKALLRAAGRWGAGECGPRVEAQVGERLSAAEAAFGRMAAFLATERPTRERGLECAGLAQVRWRQGRMAEAGALLTRAAQIFSQAGGADSTASCHMQHGVLLLGARDAVLGRWELLRAERLLDVRIAPSLGVLTAVGLACCEATTGGVAAAEQQLARARGLMARVPAESRAAPGAWREMAVEDLDRLWQSGEAVWQDPYPEEIVTLADRLLLGRAEDEPVLGVPAGLNG
jgi:hypothetical protein